MLICSSASEIKTRGSFVDTVSQSVSIKSLSPPLGGRERGHARSFTPFPVGLDMKSHLISSPKYEIQRICRPAYQYADRHIDMPTGTSICRFMPSRHIDVSVHAGRHNDMPGVQLLDLLQPLEYNRSLCCVQVGDLRAISPSFLPSTFWR